jgi:hypothetical protein
VGTLNEFTIADDEGKIIGALTGTGGAADNIEQVLRFATNRLHPVCILRMDPAPFSTLVLKAGRASGDWEAKRIRTS